MTREMRGRSLVGTDPQVVGLVVSMYQDDGRSVRYISRELQVDHTVVSRILHDRQIPIDRSRRTVQPSMPLCKQCGIVLACVAWERDGICCICHARARKVPLGSWVWREHAGA